MKKVIFLLTGAALLISFGFIGFSPERAAPAQDNTREGEINIYSSPELIDLASGWATQYSAKNLQPIKVLALESETNGGINIPKDNFILASECYRPELCKNAPWKMVIGRDPVAPVISESNPYIEIIRQSGFSSEECAGILAAGKPLTWGQVLGIGSAGPIEVYIEDNPSVLSTLSSFAGIEEKGLASSRIKGRDELNKLFSANPEAIAFISLSELLSPDKEELAAGLALMPIDINSNGKMDSFEDIYGTSQAFLRGVWIGKYPRALVNNLYLVSEAQPSDESQVAFLDFLALNGREMLAGSHFISPVNAEIQSTLARLHKAEMPEELVATGHKGLAFGIILGIILLALFIPVFIVRLRNKPPRALKNSLSREDRVLTPDILKKPGGIMFDRSHTWTFMEKDGNVRVGIDDFLQHIIGPVTRITLLNPGDKVKKGEKIIILSNKGKQVSIKSPVTGIIVDNNPLLKSDPSIINNAPYSEGWIYMIEPANWLAETQIMFMGSRYSEWLKTEFSRLKDFLTGAVQTNKGFHTQAILTDGGEIPDNALNQLGSEIWEEFQNKFIDKSIKQ